MKNIKNLETWVSLILGIINITSLLFSKWLIELTHIKFKNMDTYLFTLGLVLIAWSIHTVRLNRLNRKTEILLIGIHLLDNIRFHKIKDGKIKELLYLNSPDKVDTAKEERELKTELTNLGTLNSTEIDYIVNKLYWSK